MPFLVKTERKESQFGGWGLYAAEDIPAGTKIWAIYDPN